MSSTNTDLVRKDSIEELCGHRARAIELYALAMNTLRAAQQAHKRAAVTEYPDTQFLRDIQYGFKDDKFADTARAAIDRQMWRHFIVGTPLGSVMDAEEKKKFEDSLKAEPPEVTPDTVFATMSRLAGDANLIFRRGLVNAFRNFCGDYKSHDGFKIGQRFVIPMLVTGSGPFWSMNHYRTDAVQDLDRCMHVLDGKTSPEYQQGVSAAIRTAISKREAEVTTDYWRVRLFFGNGNAHFYPIRADLVAQANRLIAEHFGSSLGAGHSARHAA